jgi:osmotically-inducible protein OsmY
MNGTKSTLIAAVACLAVLLAVPAAADKDDAIAAKVKAALITAAIPETRQIAVQVFNGEAELSGAVESADSKAAAAQIAGTVPGVTSVRNDLTIHEP